MKIGKYLWLFLICITLFVLKNEKKRKKGNSTATASNKNYINDCLKYFPQGINIQRVFNIL